MDKCNYFTSQWFVLIWSYFQIKEEKEHVCTWWFMSVCTCGPFIPFLSAPAFIANTSLINSGRYWFAAPFEDTPRVKTPMNNKCEIHWPNSSALILKVLINRSSVFISFSFLCQLQLCVWCDLRQQISRRGEKLTCDFIGSVEQDIHLPWRLELTFSSHVGLDWEVL